MFMKALHNALLIAGVENTRYYAPDLGAGIGIWPYIGVWPLDIVFNVTVPLLASVAFCAAASRSRDIVIVYTYTEAWMLDKTGVAGRSYLIPVADPELVPKVIGLVTRAQTSVQEYKRICSSELSITP